MEINKKVLRGKVRRLPCDPCCRVGMVWLLPFGPLLAVSLEEQARVVLTGSN